jgi:hypothetical protein
VVCAEDGTSAHHATVFANALQDKYALKKTNNSASLGVGVLGSVSMPIGSSDDSMVKVASETVTSAKFYERFFALVELFLPKEVKEAAHIPEKPKTDLGMPEPKATPAPLAPESAAQPAPAPEAAKAAEVAPAASEPVAPPPEAAPITSNPTAEPAPATEEAITPPANPNDMAPPSEPIKAMPITGQ